MKTEDKCKPCQGWCRWQRRWVSSVHLRLELYLESLAGLVCIHEQDDHKKKHVEKADAVHDAPKDWVRPRHECVGSVHRRIDCVCVRVQLAMHGLCQEAGRFKFEQKPRQHSYLRKSRQELLLHSSRLFPTTCRRVIQ